MVIKDDSMLSKSKAVYARSKNIPIMTRSEFLKKYAKFLKTKDTNLEYSILPSNAVQDVYFQSMDESIATVDSEGVVKGVKEGLAEIEVYCKGNDNISFTFSIEYPSGFDKKKSSI